MSKALSVSQLTNRVSSIVSGQNLVLSTSAIISVLQSILLPLTKSEPEVVLTFLKIIRSMCTKLECECISPGSTMPNENSGG